MRRSTSRRAAAFRIAALLLLAQAASAGNDPWSLVSQDRAVSVDIDVVEDFYSSCIPILQPGCTPDSTTTTNFADSASAPDAGAFDATASRPEFPSTFASQHSEIDADAIRASGGHAATATFSNTGGFPITFHSEFHDVESRAVVSFEVDATTPYRLTGTVTTGGAVFSSSSSSLRLSGPGGVIAEVQVDSDPDCALPECFTVGPELLTASGLLDPGVYTLEARAGGTAGGAHSTSGSFGTGIDGAFEVELLLPPPAVPALPPGAVLLLALALAAAGAVRPGWLSRGPRAARS